MNKKDRPSFRYEERVLESPIALSGTIQNKTNKTYNKSLGVSLLCIKSPLLPSITEIHY